MGAGQRIWAWSEGVAALKAPGPVSAQEAIARAGVYAYRDRRQRKRDFRRLWIARINAAARINGISYSQLIHGLDKAGVEINRKMLADLAVRDAAAFTAVVEQARSHL